jgi:hypothetical protein
MLTIFNHQNQTNCFDKSVQLLGGWDTTTNKYSAEINQLLDLLNSQAIGER